MTSGENIKRIRLKKGLTQKQLGDLCGMADSAIRRYELGKANPKIETLKKIADALDVNVQELIFIPLTEKLPPRKDILAGSGSLTKPDYPASDTPIETAKPNTLAAHFDEEEYTVEEIAEIKRFAAYVKSQRLAKFQRELNMYKDEQGRTIAARKRNDVKPTEEMIKHDDDIMDDEDF
ncbi:MAG: helix-turn-helix transcriptional regulator [Firmicutes bacterium]|nr:helix-turn-helix transcriptional regulator [Bacillota bacterium]